MPTEQELFETCDAIQTEESDACVLIFESVEIAKRYHLHRERNFPQVESGAFVVLSSETCHLVAVCRDKVPVHLIDSAVRGCAYALNRLHEGKIQMDVFNGPGSVSAQEMEIPEDYEMPSGMPSTEELLMMKFKQELFMLPEKDGLAVTDMMKTLGDMMGKHGNNALLAMKMVMAHYAVYQQKMKSNAENN